ncbi:hypothetical protein [Streptococcus suis]
MKTYIAGKMVKKKNQNQTISKGWGIVSKLELKRIVRFGMWR